MSKPISTMQRPALISINAEIQNLNHIRRFLFKHYEVADDYIESLNYPDLFDLEDYENIINDITKQNYLYHNKERFKGDEEDLADESCLLWYDGGAQLKRISKNSNLYQWLLDWYGRSELGADLAIKNMYENIRFPVQTEDAIYYMSGLGYDTLSSDLLGGEMDGLNTQAFYEFYNGHSTSLVKQVRDTLLNATISA